MSRQSTSGSVLLIVPARRRGVNETLPRLEGSVLMELGIETDTMIRERASGLYKHSNRLLRLLDGSKAHLDAFEPSPGALSVLRGRSRARHRAFGTSPFLQLT